MLDSSREIVEHLVRTIMGTSGFCSLFINSIGLYLIFFHHGTMDDYRYYLLYFQTILLIFDVYFSILMVPIPLFPIIGGYSIGVLTTFFGVSTHNQMVFALWCVGNTNTCIFLSLLRRHQVVAAIEQKNVLPSQMVTFSRTSSNLLPFVGTVAFALSEPSEAQRLEILNTKYFLVSEWLVRIPGIAIYDLDFSLNPSFFLLTFAIMSGSLAIFFAYVVLYSQMYSMLKSIRTRISNRNYQRHSMAVISTVMQNLVFVLFFVSPICFLAIVIYSGADASVACIVMVCVTSLHSSANTLVMFFTFPSFRKAIARIPVRICGNQQQVSPVNNVSSRTVQRIKTTV